MASVQFFELSLLLIGGTLLELALLWCELLEWLCTFLLLLLSLLLQLLLWLSSVSGFVQQMQVIA